MGRLIESLARAGAEVRVLSLNPRKHRGVPTGPVPIEAIDIDTSRRAKPMLRALTSHTPYIVARFISREFRDAVRNAIRDFQPDVVQIESPFLLPYADEVRDADVVLRSLNVEFRIWAGLARIERRPLRSMALDRVAASLRAYELREMNSLDGVLPISADDARDFRELGIRVPMHVVPCGVTLSDVVDESVPWTAGFIGSLDFLPNQNAVQWILDELWPRVAAQAPNARLSIAGSAPPSWLVDRARERQVELLGNVPDAAAFVRAQSVILAPLFAGGGMRIKVLEAMALGKPIVATALGAGGIDVEDGRDIVIAEDAESFANAVVRLMRDRDEALRIGNAAREKVARLYDNDSIARGVLRFYESLRNRSAATSVSTTRANAPQREP